MTTYRENFELLSNMSELKEYDDEMLMKHCENLHFLLSDESAIEQHDLGLLGLFAEFKTLHHIIHNFTHTSEGARVYCFKWPLRGNAKCG